MPKNLQGRNFLKLLDFTSDEIRYLLDLSKEFKRLKLTRTPHRYLEGRNIVLLFEKTSTRTRCSFEVAGRDLGMGVTYLDPGSSQMGKKESIEDTARVLGRMYDGIEYRGFAQSIVEEIANNAGVPVWNGLTTDFHPTQMLADALTIEENFGHLKGLKVVFMGDAGNNVGNSLMVICAKMGMNFVACGPKEQMPKAELVEQCREIAKENGCTITLTEDVKEGTANADVIFVPAYYEEVGKIVKQARELGITCPMLGTDGWDDPKVADIAGVAALNNTFFSTHYFSEDPGAKSFIDAFTKEYGHAPNVFAALGYDAGKLLVDALKRANSTDPEAIRKAIEETKDLQVATAKITMDPATHNPIKDAIIIENKDGKYTFKGRIAPTK